MTPLLDAGGYPFVTDPNLSALDVHVFWLPAETPFVVPITQALPDATSTLKLENLLVTSDWAPYAAIGPPGQDFQLLLLTEKRNAPLAALLTLDTDLPARLKTTRDLWRRLTSAKPIEPPGKLSRQRRMRLIETLRALDGYGTGASIRMIATTLFGADRIPAGPEWKSHDLRSRVKRLISAGVALMKNRHRDLLRPSRSRHPQ